MAKIDLKTSTEPEHTQRIRESLNYIPHRIMIISGKGGVGKSTVASNLAFGLTLYSEEVGLVDLDIDGPNVPRMLGIEDEKPAMDEKRQEIYPIYIPFGHNHGMKVMSMALLVDPGKAVIWRGPLKTNLIYEFLGNVVWGKLDYIIVDLPPGTGDEPLTLAQNIPDCAVIVVTTPQDVALMDARRAVNFARTLKLPVIGVVENMSGSLKCPECGETIELFGEGGGKRAAEELGVPFLGSIPVDPDIVEDCDAGQPFILFHGDNPAAEAFKGIVRKVQEYFNSR